MPLSFLPPTGIVVENDSGPIAFGFLMKTDTPFASICTLVTDPEAAGKDRNKALNVLLTALEHRAKEYGYTYVSASTNHGGLAERYGKMEYVKTDCEVTIFSRYLCHS